jgi:hypothetical protein
MNNETIAASEQTSNPADGESVLNGGLEVKKTTHWCSFCGLGNMDSKVKYMVASEDANICDLCIEVCRDIIGEGRRIKDTSNA